MSGGVPAGEVPAAQPPAPPEQPAAPARPGWPAVWWRAVRPFSFTASVTPVLVGSAAAYHAGRFDVLRFLVALLASVAIHAATNLVNDYYDHTRGVDTVESVGPSGVIQQGWLAPRTVLGGGLVLFAAGGLLGLWLVAVVGWPILAIGLASLLAGYAYTGGPLPLGYVGLGDLTVFLFMGVVITTGAFYVQTGTVTAGAVWAALPVAALVTAILVANNLRDIDEDRRSRKRTLATLLGPGGTRLEYLGLILSAYIAVAAGVGVGSLPFPALIVLLTVPRAAAAWRTVRSARDPLTLTRGGVRATANLHQRLGLLLAMAFLFGPTR